MHCGNTGLGYVPLFQLSDNRRLIFFNLLSLLCKDELLQLSNSVQKEKKVMNDQLPIK